LCARRSLGTKFAVSAANGDSSGENGGSSRTSWQQQYERGASVYDASHHTPNRGYGTIVGTADPAPDGSQKWVVEWEGGKGRRACGIQEAYLDLALIPHWQRKAPTGLNQPILVVLGTHKGKTGETKRKVGLGPGSVLTGGYGWHDSCAYSMQ
jgi:hypothetical protein